MHLDLSGTSGSVYSETLIIITADPCKHGSTQVQHISRMPVVFFLPSPHHVPHISNITPCTTTTTLSSIVGFPRRAKETVRWVPFCVWSHALLIFLSRHRQSATEGICYDRFSSPVGTENRDGSEVEEILTTAHREFGGCAHHCVGKPKRRDQDRASPRRRERARSGTAEG